MPNCSNIYKSKEVQEQLKKKLRENVDIIAKKEGGIPEGFAQDFIKGFKKGFKKGFMKTCRERMKSIKKQNKNTKRKISSRTKKSNK